MGEGGDILRKLSGSYISDHHIRLGGFRTCFKRWASINEFTGTRDEARKNFRRS